MTPVARVVLAITAMAGANLPPIPSGPIVCRMAMLWNLSVSSLPFARACAALSSRSVFCLQLACLRPVPGTANSFRWHLHIGSRNAGTGRPDPAVIRCDHYRWLVIADTGI